jgi:glycerol-3-phosphate dehydrogenase
MNLVTSRPAGPIAMGAPTSDGRLLLVMPWRGRMLVGTSHSDAAVEPADTSVSQAELEAFVAEVNSAFPALALSAAEVSLVHRGVVPAEADRHGTLRLMGHHRVYDHAADGVEGAVSVVGVKYTTARGVAQQVVDLAGRKLGRRSPPCRTDVTPLPGGDLSSLADEAALAETETRGFLAPEIAARLAATHGTAWREIAARCREDRRAAEPLAPGVHLPRAIVEHAVHHEMATTLADLVSRRTSIGSAGYPGDAIVDSCANAMAHACGWDAGRTCAEVSALRAFYAPAPLSS